ncbi:MAG TPA: AAA family ATPase [Pseudonocardia sp.]
MTATGTDRPAQDRDQRLLVGRSAEQARVQELVESVADGSDGVLVIVGEPGIGKTRLLGYGMQCAHGLRTMTITGAESEEQLGFASLHRLLLPFLDRVAGLPPPQRDALQAAFGILSGPPAERFLVGLAVLTLLSNAAADGPLLCVVDDAHWLDRESLEALAFVGRRLQNDGIGLLLAVRSGATGAILDGLPSLPLVGLGDGEARALLAAAVGGPVADDVAARIVAGTRGNPLVLRELAEELTAEQMSGRAVLPEPLPAGPRLEAHFLRQVSGLPEATQTLLLLVAVAPPDDPAVLWRAAGLLGITAASADAAVREGILVLGAVVSFRHPLIRSAVYGGAPAADRRGAHEALARSTDRLLDPDRFAWHLAASQVGPDERSARLLELAATRARSRGGFSVQAALLARSAELTPDAADRAARLVGAAEAHLSAGDVTAAQEALGRMASGVGGAVVQARSRRLYAAAEMQCARTAAVPAILLDAVRRLGSQEPGLARDMLFEALEAAMLSGDSITGTTIDEVATSALAQLGGGGSEQDSSTLLLRAFATRVTCGYAQAVPLMRVAVAALRGDEHLIQTDPAVVVQACLATDDLWDDEAHREVVQRFVTVDRQQGALNALPVSLLCQAADDLRAGRFADAEQRYAESATIGAMIGLPDVGPVHKVELFAWLGCADELRSAVDVAIGVWAQKFGLGVLTDVAYSALCLFELGQCHYPEALVAGRRACEGDAPGHANRRLPDLVEAAVRAGDHAVATSTLALLTERAQASGTPLALGLLARSRAMVVDDEQAEAHYRAAISHIGATPVRTELARSHLLLGEWLRRRKRRADAREALRTAFGMFSDMGAAGFAARAGAELAATGERARSRTPFARPDLTPQERQIATMAAAGATNAEIASQLYITSSTVEYHLTKVFRKLDVTSRRQLAVSLGER